MTEKLRKKKLQNAAPKEIVNLIEGLERAGVVKLQIVAIRKTCQIDNAVAIAVQRFFKQIECTFELHLSCGPYMYRPVAVALDDGSILLCDLVTHKCPSIIRVPYLCLLPVYIGPVSSLKSNCWGHLKGTPSQMATGVGLPLLQRFFAAPQPGGVGPVQNV